MELPVRVGSNKVGESRLLSRLRFAMFEYCSTVSIVSVPIQLSAKGVQKLHFYHERMRYSKLIPEI